LGELGIFYSLADAAFIGGSIARRGGQNPIEAVKLGAAVVTGPHIDNFRDAYAALENCAGSRTVTDAESLIRVITDLYTHPIAVQAMHERAERGMAALGGALERTIEALQPYLPASGQAVAEAPESQEATVA
jgi:3-deoxy-D-manno-octulosonic-acid transferase